MKGRNVNLSLIQKSQDYLNNEYSRIERVKKAYDEFSSVFNQICENYLNEVNSIEEEEKNEVEGLKNDFEDMKNELKMKNEKLKNKSMNKESESSFIYKKSLKSKMNLELVLKYPGSYMYTKYMEGALTNDGDVHIDIDGENDEYIVKYMNDDENLEEDIKQMNSAKKEKLLSDLNSLELPIKMMFIKQLCVNEDSDIMEAWKNRIVMVNGKNATYINKWLKNNNLFDSIMNTELMNIKYDSKNKTCYINMKMKYLDVIEKYLKNGKEFNHQLLKRYNQDAINTLMNEMKMIGINLSDEEKEALYRAIEPSFIYKDSLKSEMSVELVKQYPGSYMYKEYMSGKRTNNGKIYLNSTSNNDELIVQYMNNDERMLNKIKGKSLKWRMRLIDDLNSLELPIKNKFIKELYKNDDNEMMEAWKNRRVLVNNNYSEKFNDLLKKNNYFNACFENEYIKNIKFDQQIESYFINLNMKFYDVIIDYLKNEKINKNLVKKYKDNGSDDEIIKEMEMVGINLGKSKKEEIIECFYSPLFTNMSRIIYSKEYDKYLQKWAGNHNWTLIYKASQYEYSAELFHAFCDDKGPTLIVIESSGGWIFGGYTTQSWSGRGIKMI